MFNIGHHIRNRIDSASELINHLIDAYPQSHNFCERLAELQVCSSIPQEDDPDVKASILKQEMIEFSDSSEIEDLFSRSMLVMIYAHYESSVNAIAAELKVRVKNNPEHTIKNIIDEVNVTFSQQGINSLNHLKETVRLLRNHICHNNMTDNMHFKENVTTAQDVKIHPLITRESLHRTLQEVNDLLNELCDKVGFSTKAVSSIQQ